MISTTTCRLAVGVLVVVSGLSLAKPLLSAEPWADRAMPVKDGLLLWLDATRQAQAWAASGRRPLESGSRLDAWYDASGGGRHFVQRRQESQPRYEAVGEAAVVQFDGEDDYLGRIASEAELGDFTLFVRAAPLSNAGYFRAFFAMQRISQNDYTSGMTLDMGAFGGARFDALCPEGAGFQGSQNLLDESAPLGGSHVFTVASSAAAGDRHGNVDLYFDGKKQKSRPRTSSTISMQGLTAGARCYSNSAEPPFVSGFLDGEIAEVLLFDRALADEERASIEEYLAEKYASLGDRSNHTGKRLVMVDDPPAVQMFVPGFEVRQLPIELPNINNVRYRPDGKLVALAYSGDVYLLGDSDGDGLEDSVQEFWKSNGQIRAPIGMALTPPGYPSGFGVFTPSKGKCSLLLDRDGDDVADEEVIVADGWKEGPHGVDAVGAAFDSRDGSLYFALGTEDYTNAYIVDSGGRGHYDIASERGAVLKVSPDFKTREIFATGVRFPVGMAFNAAGDLFATDQEGATWLPNGNPFDELLHIERSRHYGFPPRHPKHLPSVIDEPSVFDYSPQHQSTCGLQFNEPVGKEDSPVFGPAWWRGDALVAGYSRGKLYRTQLVKTASGYVARNQLLASLNMLTADACVGPAGELVVAVHSGGPDWGTGPTGAGKLYKIVYCDREAAQPVATWAAGPNEVRIAFDRPLGESQLKQLTNLDALSLDFGEHVRAGDRFEALRPGYEIVARQMNAPRQTLKVHAVQVSPDLRTVVLTTETHSRAAHYAISLPRASVAEPSKDALQQHDAIDLDYDLCGVVAKFTADSGELVWSGWLPHLDLNVARSLTAGSAEHESLWKSLREQYGALELHSYLLLEDMLRPAVQPGARINYEWPKEGVSLHVTGRDARSAIDASIAVSAYEAKRFEYKVVLGIDPRMETEFEISWTTSEDSRPRSLPLSRHLLPWAPEAEATADVENPFPMRDRPELAGGDWGRGRRLFFGEQAGCAKCHTHFGAGGKIGPDLSNLLSRDYASVHRDVTQPSYAINPDFLTYAAELSDGRVLTGSLRTEAGKLHFGNDKGEVTIVDRDQIESLHTLAISTMPKGIDEKLGEQGMKDLLTFLLRAPSMPDYGPLAPPPARTKDEVDAVLVGSENSADAKRPLRIVLVAGAKDHGPGEHDYPAWQEAWRMLLAADESLEVTTAWEWPSQEDFDRAHSIVFYQHGDWNNERAKQIDTYLARGGGLVYLHFAVDGGADAYGFSDRIGLAWRGGESRFRHGELMLDFSPGRDHPIARNFEKVGFHDESYWRLAGDPKGIHLLADGEEESERQPLFWTCERGKGRVFVSILGHFSWTFDDPLFRVLLLRGIAWSAKENVDRLNEMVLPGARIAK